MSIHSSILFNNAKSSMEVKIIQCKIRSYKDKDNLVSVHTFISEQHCIIEQLFASWLHRASNNVETFLLPTDAHNVKKHRVIKTF